MIELSAHNQTTYLERNNGNLVFGNKTPLKEKGTIELVIGSERFLIPIDNNGFWRWEAPTPYADGNYSISVRQFDLAGNLSAPTLATIIIDSTPPEAPDLLFLYDDQGADKGAFFPGEITDDKRPTLTGIAQKGATVYLLNDKNEKIGSALADKTTGKWVIEPSQDLEEGTNNLRLVAEETFDKQLREGAPSEVFNVVISGSTLPPDTITITDAFDNAGSFTGSLSNGALTDDATPTLRGDVSAGSTVTVYYRLAGSNVWAGSATATVTGEKWSWTPGSALAYGEYEFQASIGGFSSSLFSLDISTAADIVKKTVIETVLDDFGAWQGTLSDGAITDDATPTFSGRGEANGKIVLRFAQPGQLANTVVVDVDSSGHWTWTPASDLPAGNWTFDVQPQGQTGWSDSFDLSITGANGFDPVIDYADDDVAPGTGHLNSGSTTNDSTPTLYGRAEANSSVILRYSASGQAPILLTLTADSSGHWFWLAPTLVDSTWTFEVQKTGQVNWNSFTLDIKTIPDRIPTIEYADDNFGLAQGAIYNGANTDDTTPVLHGTGPANSTILLRYGFSAFSSVTVNTDSNGKWSWTPVLSKDLLWTFQVKNMSATTWGSEFTLYVTGPLMTKLDFENTESIFKIGKTYDWPDIDATFTLYNGSTMATSRTGNPQLGSKSLYMGAGQGFLMFFGNHSGNKFVSEFSFDFQSNSTKSDASAELALHIIDSKSRVHNLTYYTGTGLIGSKHITITPDLLDGANISWIRILSNTQNDFTIIDNISWKYPQQLLSQNHQESNDPQAPDLLIDEVKDSDNGLLFPSEIQQALPDASKAIIQAQASTLSLDSILIDGERNLLIDDNKIQMVVLGGAEDEIKLQDLLPQNADNDSWIHQAGTITVAGIKYDVYSYSEDAELLVQQGVKTELV